MNLSEPAQPTLLNVHQKVNSVSQSLPLIISSQFVVEQEQPAPLTTSQLRPVVDPLPRPPVHHTLPGGTLWSTYPPRSPPRPDPVSPNPEHDDGFPGAGWSSPRDPRGLAGIVGAVCEQRGTLPLRTFPGPGAAAGERPDAAARTG